MAVVDPAARRPRRWIVLAVVGVALALVTAVAWVGVRALLAKGEFEALVPLAGDVRDAAARGDADALLALAPEFTDHSRRAAELTSDPLWRAAEALPLLGDDLAAIRIAGAQVHALAPIVPLAGDLGQRLQEKSEGAIVDGRALPNARSGRTDRPLRVGGDRARRSARRRGRRAHGPPARSGGAGRRGQPDRLERGCGHRGRPRLEHARRAVRTSGRSRRRCVRRLLQRPHRRQDGTAAAHRDHRRARIMPRRRAPRGRRDGDAASRRRSLRREPSRQRHRGGYYGVPAGDIGTKITVAAPVGAFFGAVSEDGAPAQITTAVDAGHPSVSAQLLLSPGQSGSLEYRFLIPSADAEHLTVVHTPLLNAPDVRIAADPCG